MYAAGRDSRRLPDPPLRSGWSPCSGFLRSAWKLRAKKPARRSRCRSGPGRPGFAGCAVPVMVRFAWQHSRSRSASFYCRNAVKSRSIAATKGSCVLEQLTNSLCTPPSVGVIDLRALEFVRVVDVESLPLGVEVDGSDGGFAMAVASLLGSAERQVCFRTDGWRVDVDD